MRAFTPSEIRGILVPHNRAYVRDDERRISECVDCGTKKSCNTGARPWCWRCSPYVRAMPHMQQRVTAPAPASVSVTA